MSFQASNTDNGVVQNIEMEIWRTLRNSLYNRGRREYNW